MAKQQIPYRMTKLDDIRPYERNPRVIPQAAVDAVARSIQAFGFRAPIIVDGQGVILAGHTRYRAAQQLGLVEVPVIWQSDITDIQARGYRIADNKVGELSAWDRDALDAEVRELAGSVDANLDAIGLADWELERILHETDVLQDFLEAERRISQHSDDAKSQIAPSPSTASAASDEAAPMPDIKDNVLSIYYSLSELPELAEALGLGQQAIQKRRSYTVAELVAAQKTKCEE